MRDFLLFTFRFLLSFPRKLWLACLLAWLTAGSAGWGQSIQTILSNGSVSNRFNVVVLSEGYTNNELSQFLIDATNAVNVLLSHPPFQEYRSYFNAYAIKVASNQSGSDHLAYNTFRDTYFNSFFDESEFFIEIPPGSTGQGRVDALLQTYLPQCHLPILLVNDLTDGGSDGFFRTAIVSKGGLAYESSVGQPGMLSHESGHVMANLGDEYAYGGYTYTNLNEPNTTQETNRLLVKWKAWIDPATPVPTPNEYGDGIVGLFQGARYQPTGWYRPQLNCAMGALGVPFCAVCREALVLAVYARARPVDSWLPLSTNLWVTNPQPIPFTLSLQQPATHSLTVQWYTNGLPVPGATNAGFSLLPGALPGGSNQVKVVVHDPTTLVRNDPTNLLSQTLSWTVHTLRLYSATMSAGQFRCRVVGDTAQPVVVLSSTNLVNWAREKTNSLVNGQFWFTNAAAGTSARRFYRAASPPL